VATASRVSLFAGLAPDQWVQVFRLEDHEGDPSYQCHFLNLEFIADTANTAPVRIVLDYSADGLTWVRGYTHAADTNPGGRIEFPVYHTRAYVRCLAYSRGTGAIRGQAHVPELQTLPQFLPAERDDLACRMWCQHSCEIGPETGGTPPAQP